MARVRDALEKVAAAVDAGRLQATAKIGARAQRALSQQHGYRYYSWEVPGRGQFRFFEDPDKLQAETPGAFSLPWASRTSSRQLPKAGERSPRFEPVMTDSKPGSYCTRPYERK